MSEKYILGHHAQLRSLVKRHVLLVGLLLIILAVLQVSLFSRFQLLGATPDLMICTVLCLGFFGGCYMGAVTGIAAGFLIEAIGSTGIVLLPLCYLFCGYIAGYFAKTLNQRNFLSYLVYLALTLLFRAVITILYACMTYRDVNLPIILLQSVLPEMLVTAIAGLALFLPLGLFSRWIEKR